MRRLPHIAYPGNVTGLIYEPRAFWSVHQVDTADNPSGLITLPRADFLNGEPFPVNLTHLTFAPINYTFREFSDGAPIDAATYHNNGAAALRSEIFISAPQRQSYSRRTLQIPAWTPRPRWEPQISGTATPWASSLWGMSRWDFEHTMVIPEQGSLEIQLAGISMPLGVQVPPDPADVPQFSIAVYEGPQPGKADQPGRLLNPGNVRIHERSDLRFLEARVGAVGVVAPLPFEGDGFGVSALSVGAGVSSQFWPPDQQLSAREYDSQNATQGGSTPVTGFAVHIDQIEYDDEAINTDFAAANNQPITPLSLRTAVRARMHNGGSGHWWWRPWAPLGLVCPSWTPAQVYKLPVPITLTPGDNLEIELQTPGPITIGGVAIDPLYQIGIGLCGYAAIEG